MDRFFRVVGTGSREWPDNEALHRVFDELFLAVGRLYVAQGGARGADKAMNAWCLRAHARFGPSRIAKKTFPAQWNRSGGRGAFDRTAGYNRNRLMVDTVKPDLVLAFIHAKSGGSTQCAQYAIDEGYEVIIFRSDEEPQHVKAGSEIVLPTYR
ncbi:hypothetical protein AB0F25_30655 [Streptomyces wedmorensis]|uniref:hypothetical protein n=1 Tax=Streptomyces wedmorensis TaxID=43759 RepID=UPI00341C091A